MATPDPPLAELFQCHRHGLAGAVRGVLGPHADVAEVLQDAFLKCWRAWHRGAKPRDPVAWVFVVTMNVANDARRSRLRRPTPRTLDQETAMQLSIDAAPAAALEQQEQVAQAQAAIAQLSDDEKQVFLLKVSGELTFEAVAQALAIPVGTAKTRMRSALHKLRARLGVTIPQATDGKEARR